jgi:deazaflavin-dependent oxidoreductase (nitroreductase family)
MSFDTKPGTRGGRQPRGRFMAKMNSLMARRVRSKPGKVFMGSHALVLTTIGRKSGIERCTPVAWFPDGDDSWFIVASANGAVDNPAWYYNLAANPDKASIDIDGKHVNVVAEQVHGSERDTAWAAITKASPRFATYPTKTDREIPVIRLRRR